MQGHSPERRSRGKVHLSFTCKELLQHMSTGLPFHSYEKQLFSSKMGLPRAPSL
jgi:hypothetical protein